MDTLPLYVVWMTNELLPKIWVFGANLDEVHHPQGWRGHMTSFWEISPSSWKQKTCALSFFSPSGQVVHNRHLVLRKKKKKKKTPPKLGIICERDCLVTLDPAFEQRMEPVPQKQAMPTEQKSPHAWSMRFLCVILAHMVVDTTLHQLIPFNPRTLPPSGLQTLVEY